MSPPETFEDLALHYLADLQRQQREGAPMAHPIPVFHIGRSWAGTAIEDACPCPKAPCGLVDGAQPRHPDCTEHTFTQSIRQGHAASACPAVTTASYVPPAVTR